MTKSIAVVGSGPTGVAAAQTLLKRGYSVTLFDVGLTKGNVKDFGAKTSLSKTLMPKKKLFNSTFMYQRADGINIVVNHKVSFDTSHAKGGLSTVWGATVGAIYPQDVLNWPISYDEISENLNPSFKLTGVMGARDQIDRLYPINFKVNNFDYEVNQTTFLLNRAKKYKNYLNKNDIYIGKSKLAVQANPSAANVCVKCGKCMEGCQYDSIFSAANMLDDLLLDARFTYRPLALVKSVSESGDSISLSYKNLSRDNEINTEYFSSAVLAAGCLDTLRIVDNSSEKKPTHYTIKDSQKFYFPVFVWGSRQRNDSKSIALAHLYIQSLDSNSNLIQTQLYPGLQFLNSILIEKLGSLLGGICSKILNPVLSRTYIGMTYLHSNISGTMTVKFNQENINVSGESNENSTVEFRSLLVKLLKIGHKTGFYVFPRLYLRAKIGHSQHFGGAIEMMEVPLPGGADALGRPFGFHRVYVVDATVLPTIPATPTTTIAVSNAIRIANKIT
jgi:ferredoxin